MKYKLTDVTFTLTEDEIVEVAYCVRYQVGELQRIDNHSDNDYIKHFCARKIKELNKLDAKLINMINGD